MAGLPTVDLGQAGRAGADFLWEVMSPVTSKISNAISTLKDPLSAIDHPPIISPLQGLVAGLASSFGMGGTTQVEVKGSDEAHKEIITKTDETHKEIIVKTDESQEMAEKSFNLFDEFLPRFSNLLEDIAASMIVMATDPGDRARARAIERSDRDRGGALADIEKAREAQRSAKKKASHDPRGAAPGLLGGAEKKGLFGGLMGALKGFSPAGLLKGGGLMQLGKNILKGITLGIMKIFSPKMWFRIIKGAAKGFLKLAWFVGLFTGLINALKDVFELLFSNDPDADKSFFGIITTALSGFIEGFTFGFLDAEWLNAKMVEIWTTIKDYFNSEAWTNLKATVFGGIVAIGTYLRDAKMKIMTSIENWFNENFTTENLMQFLGAAMKLGDWITDLGTTVLTAMGEYLDDVVIIAKAEFNRLLKPITDMFDSIVSKIAGFIESIDVAITRYLLEVLDDSLAGKVLSAMGIGSGQITQNMRSKVAAFDARQNDAEVLTKNALNNTGRERADQRPTIMYAPSEETNIRGGDGIHLSVEGDSKPRGGLIPQAP